jgi:hypothetical protein
MDNRAAGHAKAPEVLRTEEICNDVYRGTRAALIAAKICRPEWFPAKLLPDMRRDGKPCMGKNGKPRMRRTYVVEGRKPETILTHRVDRDGVEFWLVHVRVSDDEEARRGEAQKQKWAESARKAREWGEQCDREQHSANARAREQETADPGPERFKQKVIESSAILRVGQICRLYAPGSSRDGEHGQVTAGYGLHKVACNDGAYADSGGRFDYLYGYRARVRGIEYFYPAGVLVDADQESDISHLRLVVDNGGGAPQ